MEDIADINISSFQAIIENYELLIKELTSDLDFFKAEHKSLKSKITTLLEENKRLIKELNALLESKENSDFGAHEQSDLIENLKQQINALISEKEYSTKLWQNSIKTIDFLEDELKVFQAGTQEFIPKKDFIKIRRNYEEKISSLENNLSSTRKELDLVIKDSSKELGVKAAEVDKSLENQAGAFKIVKNLEEEILNLQKRLQESEKTRLKLEKNVKEKEEFVQSIKQINSDCREKVKEAVQLVTAALNEKDAALFREKEANNEIQKVTQTLTDVVKETEEKVKNEVTKVKIEYNIKQDQLLRDFKMAQDEIKVKSLEIEKYSTKCKLLENEIEKIQRGSFNVDESKTSKLLILEKNLESTFQKLLVSEKQNIQLISERDAIKNDMEQMANHYERTLRTMEVEKLTLQNKTKQLQMHLDETSADLNRLTEKLESVNSKLQSVTADHQLQKDNQERLIKQSYAAKMEQINKSCSDKIKDLEAELESKTEVNKKWITETKFITENLEKLIADLKLEIHKLRKENKSLREKVQECSKKIEQYKVFVQLITKDVNKISNMTVSGADVT